MAAYYTFEDLSGGRPDDTKTDNPYHDLITSCKNDPAEIQKRYNNHRTNRNAQQKDKLLASDFPGVTIDQILAKLESPQQNPGYVDPRHCLVFWARPPARAKALIAETQQALKEVAPNLWLMPQDNLHMTALEVVHSLTEPEIDALVAQIRPHAETITDWTAEHRCRLVKPMVSFDAQALALSWLPAAGEPSQGTSNDKSDEYTYHHLRRDLFGLASGTGVTVASRYVIPSAHLTIGRFIDKSDFELPDGSVDREKVAKLVEKIEKINASLKEKYWPKEGEKTVEGGEWVVGDEKGLDFRKGTLWYGGGESVRLGRGA
ncbi:putative cyclic phosphodiesterase [Septoria linicola]|nr:putative cyclic phosphodiesterase [Septoria linicola]